jgi:hypothetical protein
MSRQARKECMRERESQRVRKWEEIPAATSNGQQFSSPRLAQRGLTRHLGCRAQWAEAPPPTPSDRTNERASERTERACYRDFPKFATFLDFSPTHFILCHHLQKGMGERTGTVRTPGRLSLSPSTRMSAHGNWIERTAKSPQQASLPGRTGHTRPGWASQPNGPQAGPAGAPLRGPDSRGGGRAHSAREPEQSELGLCTPRAQSRAPLRDRQPGWPDRPARRLAGAPASPG